jgi:hypothetical protein
MSIAQMAVLGARRNLELSHPAAADASGNEDTGAVQTAMAQVAAFIPSEALAVYVAGAGILAPESAQSKWLWFAICLALIPVLVFIAALLEQKRRQVPGMAPDKLNVKIVTLLSLFGIVAFVAWTAAMPGTPFLALSPKANAIGGLGVLVTAVLLPKFAALLGIVPQSP